MSLTLRTSKAVGWTTAAKIIQQAIQFCLTVVLMRLLGPKAFGLIGMVLVFSGFAGIFRELGFSSAIVQRPDLREEHCSTIFWLTLGTGGLLTLMLALAAPLIAVFYKQPLLRPMTIWLAFIFVLGAPGLVPRALLQKGIRFDVMAKSDVVSSVVSGAGAVIMAAMGTGVWSLVAQQLIYVTVSSVMLFFYVDWRPRFLWSNSGLRELLGYGAGLTGFNIVNYWARSADKLLIGKFMDANALGLYSRAYSLMLLPITQIISVISPVMFPALSSIQHDKARVRNAYLRVMRLLTFINFPMMLGLVVVAKPFVYTLFGQQWAGVIPLIQILSFVGMTQTLCNPVGWIYLSQGRTDWLFWWGIAASAIVTATVVVGVLLGNVETVAAAYLVGNVIVTIPCISIPARLIGMSVKQVWHAVRQNLLSSVIMAVVVWSAGQMIPDSAGSALLLIVQVLLGIGVFWVIARFFANVAYEEAVGLGSKVLRRGDA